MASILLAAAAVYCAYRVMRAGKLLNVTIWLAITSALVSAILYDLGAPEVAVIELSVGAGLVTVLFVYAFAIVGEITFDEISTLPRPLAWMVILAVSLMLGWFVYPVVQLSAAGSSTPFAQMLWQHRGLDVIAQVVLIFSGVMGLLGLLSDTRFAAGRSSSVMEWLDLTGGRRVSVEELERMEQAHTAAEAAQPQEVQL